jgi:hypothetical protein
MSERMVGDEKILLWGNNEETYPHGITMKKVLGEHEIYNQGYEKGVKDSILKTIIILNSYPLSTKPRRICQDILNNINSLLPKETP